MKLRPATSEDRKLLRDATLINVNRASARFSVEDVEGQSHLAHYFDTFPAGADFGYVAEFHERSAGVVWLRDLPPDDPGYGFVRAGVPELSVCVFEGFRGRGIGTALIEVALHHARGAGLPAVSLSVEDGNPARNLYVRHGFIRVGRNGNSDTMLHELA